MAQADWPQVEAHARESLHWAERSGHVPAQLEAKARLVLALRGRGRFGEALELAQQGLADAKARGLRTLEHRFLRWLALIHESLGDEVRSGEMELVALQVARETGDRVGQAVGLACEGLIALFYGDFAQAQRSLEESIAMKREIGLPVTEAHTLADLSVVALARGDAIRALGLARQAIALARKVEARIPGMKAQYALGEAELALGHQREAAQAFADVLALAQPIGSPAQWQARCGLARCALARDDIADALAQIEPILSYRWADEPVDTNRAPEWMALTCRDVLACAHDPRAAQWLEQAHAWMMKVADTIADEGRRAAHLEAMPYRRRIIELWAARHPSSA
jgi:tetratricopeptide (TPR) repeat protein